LAVPLNTMKRLITAASTNSRVNPAHESSSTSKHPELDVSNVEPISAALMVVNSLQLVLGERPESRRFLVGERTRRSRFRGREITADFGARTTDPASQKLECFGAGEASTPGADCFHPRNFPMRGRCPEKPSLRPLTSLTRQITDARLGFAAARRAVSQRERRDRRWRFNPAKYLSEEAGRTAAAESEARLQAAVDQALLEQGSWASNYHNFVASLTG
jgi:hypothetical protein